MITASIYGRAGRDGDLLESKSGKSWCRVSVVCEAGTDREGNKQDAWITVVAFGRQAETLAEVVKGGMVSAMGRLELNVWTDSQGLERRDWQLIANEVLTVASARPGKRSEGSASKSKGKGTGKAHKASAKAQAPAYDWETEGDPVPF